MDFLSKLYFYLILRKPVLAVLLITFITTFFAYHAQSFRLDASADSLVLENDKALNYYRSISARYGSDDYLIVTYSPKQDLFQDQVLKELKSLRDALKELPFVNSVTNLLDVPLIQSPPVSLSDLSEKVVTLEDEKTDKNLARKEFLSSPMYKNLIISPDGNTTVLQLNIHRDELWHKLITKRDQLREQQLKRSLTLEQKKQLTAITQEFDTLNAQLQNKQNQNILAVRKVMDNYRNNAKLYLGGVPMIAADSINFIRHDIQTFGIGVVCFLITILTLAFRKPRWVLLPLLVCFTAGVITIGMLGLLNWPVTVVSSNFISLLLIITLSLCVHLIVRYRELHKLMPTNNQYELVKETLTVKVVPCFYTAITTIVAFGSFICSGIRPIIDFGWIMSIGIIIAFILVFTLFPAILVLLKPGEVAKQNDWTNKITTFFARFINKHGKESLIISTLILIVSIIGISQLTVENRFIDYFKDTTEIYQGMALIDKKLGGTTPLDVIIDAPKSFLESPKTSEDSLFLDDLLDDEEDSGGITAKSYWFNSAGLQKASQIHQYLDSLPETGKVLSIDTGIKMLSQIDDTIITNSFMLSLFHKKLPTDLKHILFSPYMSDDGNQLRFAIRVFESDPNLKRTVLLDKIRHKFTTDFSLKEEQINLTGMLVLYNNMLQSLFTSQILMIGVVFVAIFFMFIVLFRNITMASVALVPNLFAAALVLGIMGWLTIPLDMMTITIAAISIGIAVDNSIHYIHRFTKEFDKDQNYWESVHRSHGSIGHAMYYTTITITLGFSILALSNFVPTIYFGLLTGFAMLMALISNLILLPLLIVRFKPLGKKCLNQAN